MNITNLYVAAKSKIFSNKSLKVYIACTLCTALLLLLLSASSASTATITVNDSGGADYTSIQAAVDNAIGGDVSDNSIVDVLGLHISGAGDCRDIEV